MASPDDVKSVDHSCESSGRFLTVACSRANRIDYLNFIVSFCLYGLGCIEKGLCLYRGLRNDERPSKPRKRIDLGFVLYHESVIGRVALYADHFWMVGITDDNNVTVL